MRAIPTTFPVLVILTPRREPEGTLAGGVAWRHDARGIARMARSYGSPAVCLGRSKGPRAGAIRP
jgi:hypothetical protein